MAEVWSSPSDGGAYGAASRLARNSHRLCYTTREMSMAGSDITIEILKDIRDEIRGTNARVDTTNSRLDVTNTRLDTLEHALSHRLEAVETTLLDLAEQQRFVVRYTKAISERDTRLEPRLSALESRIEKLESK